MRVYRLPDQLRATHASPHLWLNSPKPTPSTSSILRGRTAYATQEHQSYTDDTDLSVEYMSSQAAQTFSIVINVLLSPRSRVWRQACVAQTILPSVLTASAAVCRGSLDRSSVLHLLLGKAGEHVYGNSAMQDKLTSILKCGVSTSRRRLKVYAVC
jgi:hypothetical protein